MISSTDNLGLSSQSAAEQRVVEGMLQHNLFGKALDAGLNPEQHFTDKTLASFCQGCFDQFQQCGEVDKMEVAFHLRDTGLLDDGAVSRVIELNDRPDLDSTGAHLPALIDRIINDATQRRATSLMHRAQLHQKDGEPHKAAELAQEAVDLLRGISSPTGTGKLHDSEIWASVPRFQGELPEIDLNAEPSAADYRVFLKGIPIGKDGDLIAITARLKSYKTTIINALAASVVAGDTVDTLGLSMKADGSFLIFDTEQSEDEILMQAQAIRKRLSVSVTPSQIKVIGLRPFLPATRTQIIRQAIENHRETGIAAVAVDGVTDLCGSILDDVEATRIINFLTVAASRAEAPLFAAVHLNHGDREATGGGRGHIGKELERKAKTVLCIDKDADNIGTVYAPTNRGKPIPKEQGQRIRYDDDHGMVVSIDQTLGEARHAAQLEEWTRTLRDIEADTNMLAWKHGDLIDAIKKAEGVRSPTTAKSRIRAWLEAGILRHDSCRGTYISTLPRSVGQNDQNGAGRVNP